MCLVVLLTVACASAPAPQRDRRAAVGAFQNHPTPAVVTQARAHLSAASPSLGRTSPSAWLAWAREHGGLRRRGVPGVGQVALFGPSADVARWAGRVERVDPDGTVLLQMQLHGQTIRLRMNLAHPSVRRHPATHRVYNHYLDTGRTTAQLWLGCVVPPEPSRLVADAR